MKPIYFRPKEKIRKLEKEKMLRSIVTKKLLNLIANNESQRGLWWWTVMMFNRIDMERTKALGYNRTCAEWVLRNGACVKLAGHPAILCDYNSLPPENVKFIVKEIHGNENSGLNSAGFVHIKGCEQLDTIKLDNCVYIEDDVLSSLILRKDSLKVVEITKCKNITDDGLRSLGDLTKLQKIVVRDLPYLKNPAKVQEELKSKLANCVVDIK